MRRCVRCRSPGKAARGSSPDLAAALSARTLECVFVGEKQWSKESHSGHWWHPADRLQPACVEIDQIIVNIDRRCDRAAHSTFGYGDWAYYLEGPPRLSLMSLIVARGARRVVAVGSGRGVCLGSGERSPRPRAVDSRPARAEHTEPF